MAILRGLGVRKITETRVWHEKEQHGQAWASTGNVGIPLISTWGRCWSFHQLSTQNQTDMIIRYDMVRSPAAYGPKWIHAGRHKMYPKDTQKQWAGRRAVGWTASDRSRQRSAISWRPLRRRLLTCVFCRSVAAIVRNLSTALVGDGGMGTPLSEVENCHVWWGGCCRYPRRVVFLFKNIYFLLLILACLD